MCIRDRTGTNVATSIANANLGLVNQIDPSTSLTYDKTGSYTWKDPVSKKTFTVPKYTATTKYTGDAKRAYEATLATQKNLGQMGEQQSGALMSHLSQPFQLGDPNYTRPDLQTSVDPVDVRRSYGGEENDFIDDRQRVEQALMERMNPYIEQDRERLRTQLVNQGFRQGSEGYDRAQFEQERQINDARLGAILNAGAEQSRLMGQEAQRAGFQNAAAGQVFDMGMAGAQFGNQAQQQNLQNDMSIQNWLDSRALQNRNQPINEISALLSGSQVAPPQFNITAPSAMPTTDYAGIANDSYRNNLAAWQQNTANNNRNLASILGFAGGVVGGFK